MNTLQWTEALALGLPEMDHTHEEFVQLLAAVQASAAPELLTAWGRLIDHTEAHFGQEDRWMVATGFSSANCHATQHKVVLQVMREGLGVPPERRDAVIRQMASELAAWFPAHAQTMDASLALHLRSVGFNPETGQVNLPAALPGQPISGCGGQQCGSHAERPGELAEVA